MVRYLEEPRCILAEPLGSAEHRLKNTVLDLRNLICVRNLFWSLKDCFIFLYFVVHYYGHPCFDFLEAYSSLLQRRLQKLFTSQYSIDFSPNISLPHLPLRPFSSYSIFSPTCTKQFTCSLSFAERSKTCFISFAERSKTCFPNFVQRG